MKLPKPPKTIRLLLAHAKRIARKILAPVFDSSLGMRERTFCLISIMGLAAFAFAILVTAALNFSAPQVLARAGIWLAFFLLVFFAVRLRKIKAAIYIGAALLAFFLLPFNFFFSGGIAGGCAIWNLFVLACVSYVVDSKAKYVFIAGNIALFLLCCAVECFYPELAFDAERERRFAKIFVYVIAVSAFLCIIILFQNKIYKEENELALKQKKEIEELNVAQNRFFSSMSHEIRAPINTIVGLNEMILREEASEEIADSARIIQGAGKMLLSLVNNILDISKIDAGKMEIVQEPYDTGAMLSEIANMFWLLAKKRGIDFRMNIDGAIPARLVGDEMRIKQVLINILNNAIKYTRKGNVTLYVQCEKIDESEGVAGMVYSVADTGIGIRQENIPRLFDVFKRVDQEKTRGIEGTGLGLAIVKQLVDLMGGEIEVNSVYTQGTTFVVRLPQNIQGAERIDGASIEARHGVGLEMSRDAEFAAPEARVLIVDDSEANLMVVERLLRETHVKTDTAQSGRECLKKTLQSRYDVIFMDHLMPEMDGIECLHQIRKQQDGLNADTPVVVVTANAGSENNALYKSEGFDGILPKPVTGRQLEAELLRRLPLALVKMSGESETDDLYVSPIYSATHKEVVMIATDSAADIPRELVAENNIAMLPAVVETDGGSFLDGFEIDQDGLERYLAGGGERAASLEREENDFFAFFADCLAKAQRVVYIPVSSAIANHFDAARKAARSFSSVTVFDSWNLSSGLGLIVLKACEYARQGMGMERLLEELAGLRGRISASFVVDSTKYLFNAGRLSKPVSRICDSLMLHPIIILKRGRMTVASVKLGSKDVFWKKYVRWALRKRGSIDKSIAFITHSGMEYHRLREIESAVKSKVNFERVYFQKASAAVSANCGPCFFGIIFMRKGKG